MSPTYALLAKIWLWPSNDDDDDGDEDYDDDDDAGKSQGREAEIGPCQRDGESRRQVVSLVQLRIIQFSFAMRLKQTVSG